MPDIRYVQDKNEEVFYPVTHERAVRDSDGVKLSTKLSNNTAVITNIGNLVTTLYNTVDGMSTSEMVVAWDGSSSPTVANIPYGVSVEYDGTTYTGSLAASASTMNKIYLVGNEDDDTKLQYVTSFDGTNYSWTLLGSTDIDLSDYQRKDDEVWLTEDEFRALAVKDPSKVYNVYEEVSEP